MLDQKSFPGSTAIGEAAYDDEAEELTIWFTTGKVYRYHGVPALVWGGLSTAESAGGYFNQHIVGRYRYDEMERAWRQVKRERNPKRKP